MKKINRLSKRLRFYVMDVLIGVKNIIIYSKIIYRDRDWDYAFLLYLLRFKLMRMKRYFGNSNIIIEKERREVEDQITEVIDLIDMYHCDEFCDKEYADHTARWGERRFSFEPVNDSNNQYVGRKCDFTYEKAKTEEETNQASMEMMDIHHLSDKQKQECWNAFWRKLSERAQWWWD